MGKSILPPSPARRRTTRAAGPAEHEAGLPPKQRRTRQVKPRPVESSSEDEEDESDIKVGADGQEFDQRDLTWDGPPVKKRPNGDTYYLAFRIEGERCAIGEWVWLKGDVMEDGSHKKMLARIDNTWEDGAGVMWCELLWFYTPEELYCGRLESHGEREVFESNLSDENEIACVLSKCKVVNKQEYDALSKDVIEENDIYFCRYHYNPVKKSFSPYLNRATGVKGKNKTRVSQTTDRLMAFSGPAAKPHTSDNQSIAPTIHQSKLTQFDVASHALQLSTVPDCLPCRETEQMELRGVLAQAIHEGHAGGCIYISGVPGTGKTASVHAIIRELRDQAEEGQLPAFQYIEINGQRLPEPASLYSVLLQGLTGRKAHGTLAAQQLDAYFGSKQSAKADVCVLLVDELDYLVTRKQTVLYNLFDWPTRPNSRLVVLGIANTMDLPERMLPRIVSRLGLRRITFSPYTYGQLDTVIKSRLKQLEAFDTKAIELCSRKVAAVSGDVRKALQICRQACELARAGGSKVVTLSNIEMAVKQLYTNPYVAAIKGISLLERVVVVATAQALKDGIMAFTSPKAITQNAIGTCRSLGVCVPTHGLVSAAIARLIDIRLLQCGQGGDKLELCVQRDDVAYALKDDPLLKKVASACA